MSIYEILREKLKEKLKERLKGEDLELGNIAVMSKALTAEEAIGITQRKDFPILAGKEIMIEADFKGFKGQAFTSSPVVFKGTLCDILNLDIENNSYDRSIFIAALNAVMRYLGEAEATIHCKNEQPELCAQRFPSYIKENFGLPKIALIGFQPAMLEGLKDHFELRVLDLNPETCGTVRYGITIEDGIKAYKDAVLDWADLVLCTGSTICNGSIVNFIEIGKSVLFYGTTISGAAPLLGLKRVCFYGA